MSIGYACLAIGVEGSDLKNCIQKNATPDNLLSLISHNLNALEAMIDYNRANGIGMFRISSDLIPFGSSFASKLPWETIYQEQLIRIGNKITEAAIRVSMHPGQYTVLNSPDDEVVKRAILELEYHAKVLDSLQVGSEHKMILHLGGVYGDKKSAKARFAANYQELSQSVKKRLVLENDGSLFHIEDILETAQMVGMPVVYDNLHNATCPRDKCPSDMKKTDAEWIQLCAATWKKEDGRQKIHYSQQNPQKRIGAHSETIAIDTFLAFYHQTEHLNIDIMLEVKDKNISALKCIHCTSACQNEKLEQDWERYRYSVLEHDPSGYEQIVTMLKNGTCNVAIPMYKRIEQSMNCDLQLENQVNAAEYAWEPFKNLATAAEKRKFERLLVKFISGGGSISSVKKHLKNLSVKYRQSHLLQTYYFYLE